MANLKKRGWFFSVQFRWDGKQYIKPLRLEDETEAERVKASVEVAIEGLKRGRFPKASRLLADGHDIRDIIFPSEKTAHLLEDDVVADDGNPLRVSQLAEDYVKHLAIEASDGHRRRVESKLRHLTNITDDARVSTLNADGLDEYIKRRRKSRAKPDTLKGEIATTRAMLNWAVQTRRIDKLPVERFPNVKTSGGHPFLFKADIDRMIGEQTLTKREIADLGRRMVLNSQDVDELAQLAERESPQLVLPLRLVATTGIRRGELVQLRKSDFDPKTGRLTVRSGKGPRSMSETSRSIDVHKSVLPLLREHHRSLSKRSKWLFPQFDPTKTSKSSVAIEDRRAERAARLLTTLLTGSDFELLRGWHALRHSFITICVWRGMTFEQISQWTGHIERETQRRYTHYSGEASRKLMDDLPFVFSENSE